MFTRMFVALLLPLFIIFLASVTAIAGGPANYRVLVVMSYDDTVVWEKEVREGIESVLGGRCDIRFFYLDTKYNFSGGSVKAREAFRLYQEFRPDGVIAADDDAQSLFVVPYLRNMVKTPVVFCGVNAEPEIYGYPASNVTGILERAYFRESVAFLKQLVPSVKNISYLTVDNTTGRTYFKVLKHEAETYSLRQVDNRLVTSLDEAVAAVRDLKNRSDALFLTSLEGLKDNNGRPVTEKQVFPLLARIFEKPVIGINGFAVRSGLLCGVAKSGKEQGETAARVLLKVMHGAPVSQVLIATNRNGKRMINVTVMKKLGIKPRAVVLRGAELVTTQE